MERKWLPEWLFRTIVGVAASVLALSLAVLVFCLVFLMLGGAR